MKKLELSGISAAPKSARPTHPTIQVEGDMEALLKQFTIINPQFKTLKNQSETISKQLAPHIRATYFARYAGITPDSSTMLATVDGKTIKLTVKNAYSTQPVDEEALVAAIGQELLDKHFKQSTSLVLDLDKAPEDKAEEFAVAVITLARTMGLADEVVTAKQCIKPRAGFHEARTTILSADQNRALDALMPVTAYPQL